MSIAMSGQQHHHELMEKSLPVPISREVDLHDHSSTTSRDPIVIIIIFLYNLSFGICLATTCRSFFYVRHTLYFTHYHVCTCLFPTSA